MKRTMLLGFAVFVLIISAETGCRSVSAPDWEPAWDVERAEVVRWHADDPSFEQDFAIEASGLAASRDFLYVSSEKYGRLLLVNLAGGARVRTVRLSVPHHSEIEGVALISGGVIVCDEAHAAVYQVPIAEEPGTFQIAGGEPLPVTELVLEGVGVRGGKIGFEGIEVGPDDGLIYLLLERSGTDATGCVSRIWSLSRDSEGLRSDGGPVEVVLEDCAWRLTGLAWWNDRLIALKTQFPGEQYQVVTVDLSTGRTKVILDLTELLRSLAEQGWSNNVEGIAVGEDDSLWLVADNAVTGVIDNLLPPRTDSRTLLLRLPPARALRSAR